MIGKITVSADDPQLKPVDPVLQSKVAEDHFIAIGDPILPEEFGQRVDAVLSGKIKKARFFVTAGAEHRFEEYAMVVPSDENGVKGEPALGCQYLVEENGEQDLAYTFNTMSLADQRFDYTPTPESVEDGVWDDKWDVKTGTWKE